MPRPAGLIRLSICRAPHKCLDGFIVHPLSACQGLQPPENVPSTTVNTKCGEEREALDMCEKKETIKCERKEGVNGGWRERDEEGRGSQK